jgi:hypothetical protein
MDQDQSFDICSRKKIADAYNMSRSTFHRRLLSIRNQFRSRRRELLMPSDVALIVRELGPQPPERMAPLLRHTR